jgi:hypothetical protein
MKNQDILIDLLERTYVRREDKRLQGAVVHNDTIFITDGYSIVSFPENLISELPSNLTHKAVNIFPHKIIDPKTNKAFPLAIEYAFFEKFLTGKDVKAFGEWKDCKECMGTAVVTWEYRHYKNDFDCPVCDGSGHEDEVILQEIDKKGFEENTYIAFEHHIIEGSFIFDKSLFMKLVMALEYYKDEEVSVTVSVYEHCENGLRFTINNEIQVVILCLLEVGDFHEPRFINLSF